MDIRLLYIGELIGFGLDEKILESLDADELYNLSTLIKNTTDAYRQLNNSPENITGKVVVSVDFKGTRLGIKLGVERLP